MIRSYIEHKDTIHHKCTDGISTTIDNSSVGQEAQSYHNQGVTCQCWDVGAGSGFAGGAEFEMSTTTPCHSGPIQTST